MAKIYTGMNIDEKVLERLSFLSLLIKKNRTELINEAIECLFDKYSDKFDDAQEYIINLNK